LSAISRLGEGLWVLSEPGSRPSEVASPKRDVVTMCDACLRFSSGELEMGVWARDDLS